MLSRIRRFLSLFPRPVARGAIVILALAVVLSLCTRFALLAQSRGDVGWDFSLVGAFLVGTGVDLLSASYVVLPWVLFASFFPNKLWPSKWGRIFASSMIVIYALSLLFNGVAEWFFWDEFQVRYNFIAVDYLVWTQEVWGNIWESYPMPLIFTALGLGAAGILFLLKKTGILAWICETTETWSSRGLTVLGSLVIATLVSYGFSSSKVPAFKNQYTRELANNGLYSLGAAFWKMEIDYDRFYRVLPTEKLYPLVRKMLTFPEGQWVEASGANLRRKVAPVVAPTVPPAPPAPVVEKRWNVILICMESLSAEFMGRFKSKKGLTPNMDKLAGESLLFSKLYATGTRTVRGMEALTMGQPPTPGQAILYRPASTGLDTIFQPFLQRGYDCAFLYGGDGSFDYMNRYFGGNGCRVLDTNYWKPEDITFKTSWGACDEDLYRKTISEADANFAAGKKFHFFCMTTSNHRPFQFPSGKIDMASDTGRSAAVKYHDYAIGQLVAAAKTKPWFAETLFVFCADHCASSAGKVELDVTKFHIPAMIWNPSLVPAQEVKRLCSQVDVMPTTLALMGWNWESVQYGRNVLDPNYKGSAERAFVSNYQRVALLKRDALAILKPQQEATAFQCDMKTGALTPNPAGGDLLDEATAYYQSASTMFKTGALRKLNPTPK